MQVLKPINVPDSDRCWETSPPFAICDHFDNEGGHPTCGEGLGMLEYAKDGGVNKCEACLKLKVATKTLTRN